MPHCHFEDYILSQRTFRLLGEVLSVCKFFHILEENGKLAFLNSAVQGKLHRCLLELAELVQQQKMRA